MWDYAVIDESSWSYTNFMISGLLLLTVTDCEIFSCKMNTTVREIFMHFLGLRLLLGCFLSSCLRYRSSLVSEKDLHHHMLPSS
jgi:hypothetical protein